MVEKTMLRKVMSLPADYPRLKQVHSFQELLTTPFQDGVNALCWPRTLVGDFGEVVAQLKPAVGITTLDGKELRKLPLSTAGKMAVKVMLADQRMLRDQGLDPGTGLHQWLSAH